MRSRSVGLTSRCTAALLSGVLVAASAAPAFAQGKPPAGQPAKPKKELSEKEKKAEAGKLFKEANAKFDKADYAGAVTLYEQAEEMWPGAKPKQRAAICYDKLGKVKEAVSWYEKFLADNPDPDKFKADIADAKSRLEALKSTPAKVKVTTEPPAPPGLKLAVDGAVQPGPELSVPPGKHTISATADGFDAASQEIEVAFAETKDLALTLNKAAPPVVAAPVPAPAPEPAPVAAPKPEPEKPAEPRSNVPAYVSLGLAGAGAVVGTIFGIQALSAKSDFDAQPTDENAETTDRNALIADMSFAIALTFGVTGTVLLLSNDSADDAKSAKRRNFIAAPYVGPTGGGAAASFKF